MPDIEDPADRRDAALEHLQLSLDRASQFHRALDVPAELPEGTTLHLFAGDARETPQVIEVDERGRIKISEYGPGDNTVLRSSALMDERVGADYEPYLRTPIDWDGTYFLNADHLGLTRDVGFTNNGLFLLLEAPRASISSTRSKRGTHE